MPQGIGADLIATLEGWSRADVDTYAAESQHRAAKAQANGYFDSCRRPGHATSTASPCSTATSSSGPTPRWRAWPASSRRSPAIGRTRGFDDVALEKYHWVEKINHVHHAGNSSGIVDGAALMAIGTEQVGTDLGLTPRARIIADRRLAAPTRRSC